jgi:hypothetical protein
MTTTEFVSYCLLAVRDGEHPEVDDPQWPLAVRLLSKPCGECEEARCAAPAPHGPRPEREVEA